MYGYFQTDFFFILLRRAEAITWENFVPAKRDPGSTKAGSHDKIYEEFTILPGSRQSGTEFHSGKTVSCNHPLSQDDKCFIFQIPSKLSKKNVKVTVTTYIQFA